MAEMNGDVIEQLVQEVFADRDGLKRLLEVLLQATMQSEVSQHIGAERHQRSAGRSGHRNGLKPRKVNTRIGELDLQVPQVRGCDPYHPSMFNKWQRSERALLVACGEMYFQGVSTRNVRNVLEQMCGGDISSATVSRVAQEVDEKLLTFRHRRLDSTEWPYVQIDARYEKVRVDGHVVSQAVLVTIGFDSNGKREVLDWRVGDSESDAHELDNGSALLLDKTNPLGIQQDTVLGTLSDILNTDTKYERALAAVIRSWLDAVVVGDVSAALSILSKLSSRDDSSVRLVVADLAADPEPQIIPQSPAVPLLSHVQCPDNMKTMVAQLLQNVFVVESLDAVPSPIPAGAAYVALYG